eukprot:CAMPEP_0201522478 /NCGR_PEP_ID=MMETSP0161_2-20130828/17615_1 /ASSEMBLY_ACC=CAM_ASM_000251 /TAXON_ID=180227 /ORGANISM="Neoparamoeba aestuarina, Strain SoJaBio B1-5/56/2" /LENGTH=395 /DNA_ID=CAMNT_0047921331 /DNA_START=21 /DNA_END=1208 /DNA_ORIENTATION=+
MASHDRISYHLSSARTVYQLLQLSADGKTQDIKEMIQSGVNVNAVDYDKRSALHLAAAEGRFDTVKFLVERGANVNAVDRFGGTPLRDALEAKRYDISSYLRSHGSTLGERSDFLVQKVCHAASEGNVFLLENVFENSFLSIDASDYDNRSPLHLAAACNHKKACEYLLKKGANPRALDRFGNTAIQEALREGHPELSKFIEEFDPKDKALEEKDSESEEEEEEGELLSDGVDQLSQKEKYYRSAVVVFIQSFYSHVLEEEENDDEGFGFDSGNDSESKSSYARVKESLDKTPDIFKDLYLQFKKKFRNHSIDEELDQSLRKEISSLAGYDRTILNYFVLFNEECVKTNFFEEDMCKVNKEDGIYFRFSTNFFLAKHKSLAPKTGTNIRLEFDFS